MPILGIDAGASKIHYLVLDGEQRPLEGELKISTPTKDTFINLCQKIKEEIQQRGIKIEKVGIGLPGTVENGILTYVPNFPALEGWNAGNELFKIFAVPVIVFNDAKAFVFAETSLGAAKNVKNVIGLTLGSGLGGGLYINGALYVGKGAAGEVGHEIVDLPNKGEAEDFVSAKFFQRSSQDPNTLREKAEAGDENAKQLFREFGQNLGVIVANLVNLLDPETIVLGGGISGAYDLFIKETRETVAKFVVNPSSKSIPVLRSALGPSAGAVGAALLALEKS